MLLKVKQRKIFSYIVLSIVGIISLLCNLYLFSIYTDTYAMNTELNKRIGLLNQQIDARNSVIDKELGINLIDPLSHSKNIEKVKKKYKIDKIITDAACEEIILPLYTPDNHYFGEISYAAYQAIIYDQLNEYNALNNEELQILHSYMNYITLNPGLSLVKY